MELSSCPQCTTRRNIPISFSFFLTNRFHLVLSCKHCNVSYVPTMLQRIVQFVLVLALGAGCGLLFVPVSKLELALSEIGFWVMHPIGLFALLLLFALSHWLPLHILPRKKLESTAAFHRGRSVAFFIISFVFFLQVMAVVACLFDWEFMSTFYS